ncbi:MAG TPA: TolC family protein [Tepidisphaeraceae bacterium]|jgi:cobalt-zinc-cadmium efflux system outer membrane protein
MAGINWSLATSLSSVVLIGGCAAVQPRQSFSEIEQSVSQRTPYRVYWNDGSDADKAVAGQIDTLLAKPFDADAAVQIALLNNRALQAVYEEIGVAQAELVGAGLLRNPIFDGSIKFAEGGGGTNLEFGVAFEFLDVFFIGARKRLAESQLEAAKANVTAAVVGMAGDVKAAFYDLQAAQQMAELRQQVQQATAASYDLARRLREAGNNTPLDLAQERALHEEARLALAEAEAQVEASREALTRLMGLWGKRVQWTIAGRLPDLPAEEIQPHDLERRAIKNSLALSASRAEMGVAFRELGITQPLGYLSELEVGAEAERDDGEWEVGPALSLPIPLFSQGQPAVARAQAQLRAAEARYYAEAVEIRSNIRAAYAKLRSLRQRAEHYRTIVLPLRQTIVDQTQLQYNAMQLGAFQLLQAKRDQIETAGAYLSLLRDYWLARTELELGLQGRSINPSPLIGANAPSGATRAGNSGSH